MKKTISFILLYTVLLSCLSGCTIFDQFFDPSIPTELREALVNYLYEYHMDIDVLTFTDEQTIDAIKQGKSSVHVAYDPNSYYFVCGYYKGDHEDSTESRYYCCREEYVWVKYKNVDEIQEYYNDAKMVVAFQLNKALFVKDLLTGKKNSSFKENFQLYTPIFVDGLNTNTPIDFSETFIFVNMWNLQELPTYYSTSTFIHRYTTWSCIAKEDRYYMMLHWYHLNSDGECTSTTNLELGLGKHYDDMMNIMCQETYSIPHTSGAVNVYALFELNDFIEMISK